jgi:thioredoxin-like negative regulator of GroEL
MNGIQSSTLFDQMIAENTFVLIYLSGLNCSVCQAVKPKIEKLIHDNFLDIALFEISTNQLPELAARLSVFTIPVILFFVEGKEYIREVRFIEISLLKQKIEKILSLYKK